MKKFLLQTCLSLAFFSPLLTQAQFQKLDSLDKSGTKLYYSKGYKERADKLAALVSSAINYNNALLGFKPEVSLLVLSKEDWDLYTDMPVFGMPHYTSEKVLVVAAHNNDFWKSFIPPLEQLPQELANNIKVVYQQDGEISMQAFFDLLALHELGHAFHQQGGLQMQRKWMGEFFCNVFLHTYIAENKPGLLPALKVFPEMVVAGGAPGEFTSLDQFEKYYNEIATKHPRNYGWYQSRFHVEAGVLYDKGGKEVLVKLWNALEKQELMDDGAFAKYLSAEVHEGLGQLVKNW